MITFETIVGSVVGFLVVLGLGNSVKKIVNSCTKDLEINVPTGLSESVWKDYTANISAEGGKMIGFFERTLAFVSIWTGLVAVLGGWLAFKLASKWQVWSSIIKLPDEIEGVQPLEYAVARRKWGSKVFTRFVVGTIANILAGFTGVIVGH